MRFLICLLTNGRKQKDLGHLLSGRNGDQEACQICHMLSVGVRVYWISSRSPGFVEEEKAMMMLAGKITMVMMRTLGWIFMMMMMIMMVKVI